MSPFKYIILNSIFILVFTNLHYQINSAEIVKTISYNSRLPIRRIIEYEFNVSWFKGAPNGIVRQILGVNGQFPGPTIRGTKGDLLRVRVTNQIQNNLSLSIHWHGLHQLHTTFQDGVEQVSQCPLSFGQSQIYEFQLLQTGTHWWHSHHGPWLADGLWGLLIVDNDPEVWGHLYNDEISITLTDWFAKTGDQLTDWYLSPDNPVHNPPFPHSVLINGEGYYPCHFATLQGFECIQKPEAPVVIEVVQGATYRLRLLSAASAWVYRFSIDNHSMECIEVDGVDTELGGPVNSVNISTAMRYSFIIKMDAEGATVGSEFYIRAPQFELPVENQTNINPFTGQNVVLRDVHAILRYVDGIPKNFAKTKNSLPPSPPTKTNDIVPLLENQHCIPFGNDTAPDHYDDQIVVKFENGLKSDGSPFWTTNGVQYKIVDGEPPAILQVLEKKPLPEYMNALYTKGNGGVVQLVINNRHRMGHPVHLHGHSFWIVGVGKDGEGDYSPAKHAHRLQTKVPKRDTTRVSAKSWIVFRYVAHNPGVWLLHCHVNWHIPGGMAAVIVEGPDLLPKMYENIPRETLNICAKDGIIYGEIMESAKGSNSKPAAEKITSNGCTKLISYSCYKVILIFILFY